MFKHFVAATAKTEYEKPYRVISITLPPHLDLINRISIHCIYGGLAIVKSEDALPLLMTP
jgi:hypothetical protein